MPEKYIVNLSPEEREYLHQLTHKRLSKFMNKLSPYLTTNQQSDGTVLLNFIFPNNFAITNVCQQYLAGFTSFLKNFGVETLNSIQSSDAGNCLFSIGYSPTEKSESVTLALALYFYLPCQKIHTSSWIDKFDLVTQKLMLEQSCSYRQKALADLESSQEDVLIFQQPRLRAKLAAGLSLIELLAQNQAEESLKSSPIVAELIGRNLFDELAEANSLVTDRASFELDRNLEYLQTQLVNASLEIQSNSSLSHQQKASLQQDLLSWSLD